MNQDITTSPYFFYGCPGQNTNGTYSQYGLWEPMSDRLVIVSRFSQTLMTIAMLFSGRVILRPVRLDTAMNFDPSLVDNSCCTNWTIANKDGMRLSLTIGENAILDIHEVTQLVPAAELSGPELIVENQEYLLATCYWATEEEARAWPRYKEDNFSAAELKLLERINLPMPLSNMSEDVKRVQDIIFLEPNFKIAKSQIDRIISKYEYRS